MESYFEQVEREIKASFFSYDIDEELVMQNPLYSYSNNDHYLEHCFFYGSSGKQFQFSFLTRKRENREPYPFSLLFINLKKFVIYDTSQGKEIIDFIAKNTSKLEKKGFLDFLKNTYQYQSL